MRNLLTTAIWFGILCGLVEGPGLLLFQRVNSASWGPMLHVSAPILWISVVVDTICFLVVAILAALISLTFRLKPPMRLVMFLLSAITAHNWLSLTGRLTRVAGLLLAIGIAAWFTRWVAKREDQVLRFWSRTLPRLAAIAVLSFVTVEGGARWKEQRAISRLPAASANAPNVLVIVIDTLRADHLSAYGYSRPTSPNIDRLAQQGVLFENAFSTCSWSLPSHASLVTGRYQFEHGVDNMVPIPVFGTGPALGGYPTLGEAFEHRGYRTGAFSANRAWFSHDLGFGRGFIHFEDYFHSASDSFVRTALGWEFSRIVLARTDHSKYRRALRWMGFRQLLDRDEEGFGAGRGSPGVRKRATVVNQELLRWIDRGPSRPFFAFLNYFDAHEDYGGPAGLPPPKWSQENVLDKYDNGVKYVDDAIGTLLHSLQERGLADNTLIVLTSDHGEELGQHGLRTHGGTLYVSEIRVPLIFWYPGHIPAGVRVPSPVTNSSIAATVLNASGDDQLASEFPSSSLSQAWTGTRQLADSAPVLSEIAQNAYSVRPGDPAPKSVPMASAGSMKSLISGDWHLIVHSKSGLQVYDWVHDPAELVNLIDTESGKHAAGKLSSSMQHLMQENRPGAE